jgi:Dyp-type peroxidase family
MTESHNDLLEPVLDVHEIQGNILAGFNKDHQTLLGFAIEDPNQAKKWIGLLSKQISALYEVQNFNKIHKSLSKRLGVKEPPGINATWTNVAFSYIGLKKLIEDMDDIDPHFDESFKAGLTERAIGLGDPADKSAEGNPWNWVVGSTNPKCIPVPDVILIVASDSPESLEAQVSSLISQANSHGIRKIYQETGHDLSYYGDETKKGHEHFGFKDGISQPGVRGRLSNNPTNYLTPRPDIQQSDPDSPEFSSTGRRPLVAPGQFVIGYPVQNLNHPREANPPPPAIPILTNGSYLVYRRLRQDVEAFEKFVTRESQRLSLIPGFSSINAEKLKALIVGRWPSGAPLSLSPEHDNPQLGEDPAMNNSFGYTGDEHGYKTPVISHIRKVNPRDLESDQAHPANTLKFRILRRGIPFGEPFDKSKPDRINGKRGLIFVSYQASIREQFEFVVQNWMNNVNNPTNAPHPPRSDNNTGDGASSGFDILVGQKQPTNQDPNRVRFGYIQAKINNDTVEGRISNKGLNILDWVIPTGGGYFFSPSISSLKFILGSQ